MDLPAPIIIELTLYGLIVLYAIGVWILLRTIRQDRLMEY